MSLVKDVLDGNWVKVQEYMEKQISDKIIQRVQEKKVEVLAKINGTTTDKMKEVIAVSQSPLNKI